ncbi:hypothetical protein ACIQXD_20905 [Streptomyces uncialis]|uniref:hypothetical protein n=1 Tax=Streptomyces uncialis TaxID=1048205 RepID=UPI003820B9E5
MSTQRRQAGKTPTSAPTDGTVPVTAVHPAIEDALDALDTLVSALRRAGIKLPALDIRTPWPDEGRDALVHIGPCSAQVARALAAVIVKGASR